MKAVVDFGSLWCESEQTFKFSAYRFLIKGEVVKP